MTEMLEEVNFDSLLGGADTETITLKGGGGGSDDEDDEPDYTVEEDDIENRLNSIQEILDDFIKSPLKTELIIPIALDGHVDFTSVQHIPELKKIAFLKPGKVTKLSHLPEHLVELECPQQLLSDLGKLPKTLQILVANENKLNTLDLADTPRLVKLNVNDNELKTIINLASTSLKELYCDYNQIETLDLNNTSIEIFHICNNQGVVVIRGLPTQSLKEFKIENTNHTEQSGSSSSSSNSSSGSNSSSRGKKKKKETAVDMDVFVAMIKYYQLKRKYLNSIANKKAKDHICFACKKTGGMVFEDHDRRLFGRCGHKTDPCDFSIEIYKSEFVNLQKYRSELKNIVHQIKQDGIAMKYDVTLGFIENDQIVQKQKLYTEALHSVNEQFTSVNQIWMNEKRQQEKKDAIQQTQELGEKHLRLIQSEYAKYKQNPDKNKLHHIIDMQLRLYQPCMNTLHQYQYESLYQKLNELHYNHNSSKNHILVYDDQYFLKDMNVGGEPPKVVRGGG